VSVNYEKALPKVWDYVEKIEDNKGIIRIRIDMQQPKENGQKDTKNGL